MASIPEFTNNFSTTLTQNASVSSDKLYLDVVDGLPDISDGNYFRLTIKRESDGQREIVRVTSVDNISRFVSVERGDEGTTPTAFSVGDEVELRLTAAPLNYVVSELDRLTTAEPNLLQATQNSIDAADASAISEANAAASASAAATSESNASSSASSAAVSESNAQSYATAADNSRIASQAAQAAAEAVYDDFDDRYLGAKATEPTTDNDGDVLTEGVMYFNTTDGNMYVYTSVGWTTVSNTATSDAAANSAAEALASEQAAALSESNASASASAALTSEQNALASEQAAALSESNAGVSESNALASEQAAASIYDQFDDRYLGSKAADPSVDNDGDALIEGALYWNSTAKVMRVWDGVIWKDITIPDYGSAALADIGTASGEVIGTDEANDYYGLQYKPSVSPTLSSRFSTNEHKRYEQYGLEPKTILQQWDVARNSEATYFDANGVLQTAGINEPRIDYDPATGECRGLLVEGQATNLTRWSENLLGGSHFGDATVLPNVSPSPDGLFSADKIVGAVGVIHWFTTTPISVVQGARYTHSRFLKYAGIEEVDIQIERYGSSFGRLRFNVVTGEKTFSGNGASHDDSRIDYIGNGWFRVSVSYVASSTGVCNHRVIIPTASDGNTGVYVWGTQT